MKPQSNTIIDRILSVQNAAASSASTQLSPNQLTPISKTKTGIKARFFRMVAGKDSEDELVELDSAEKANRSPRSSLNKMLKQIEENLLDSLKKQGIDTSKLAELVQLEKANSEIKYALISYQSASEAMQQHITLAAKLAGVNPLPGFIDFRPGNEKNSFALTDSNSIFCDEQVLAELKVDAVTFVMAHELVHAKYLDTQLREVLRQLLLKDQQGNLLPDAQILFDNFCRFHELRADTEAAIADPLLAKGYNLFAKKLAEKFGEGFILHTHHIRADLIYQQEFVNCFI